MDENNNLEFQNQSEEQGESISELSHTDKLVGIFVEPSKTYEKISLFPPKTMDWLLPFLLLLITVIISNFVLMSNPAIKAEAKQKQLEGVEKSYAEMIKQGKMTKEEAERQMEVIEQRMEEFGSGPTGLIIQAISILIMGFIMFLIVSGIYFLLAKFVLKGEGVYSSVLVASGLTSYIGIIQVILATIISLLLGSLIRDTSIGSLMSANKEEFVGFLLSKLDVITIWTYFVLSIGLSRMFKSTDTKKYATLVFGLWIVWSVAVFFLSKSVPFLKNLGG